MDYNIESIKEQEREFCTYHPDKKTILDQRAWCTMSCEGCLPSQCLFSIDFCYRIDY